ncbi:molybdate ABC transporter substrate-binding protein [Geomonas sp. Red69]|uniref:Molybdate ABC transporter substrate-binding protein n=1 Tax=Geomonas diazotrophica TaxID=2843197 RepID=A0ABX8JMH3_9BACT|nr:MULTISPECIES: molybdate ABC transporter substrate-binding protein [Geomonas]MBU5635141.1 molybdate ABC transporter substrate-binding protein [Geomonas diazotrophica]QWV97812.1 molybdate ABC transporter substrate-binding protein [Geomonas nitrogeniifigens]QXE86952.1 molybdate ABC transporter substrate-binding protein [Geomonas nitrogeniifigens]
MRKLLIQVASSLFVLLLLSAPALAGEVAVSAAASLKEAVNELAERFAKAHPGVRIVPNYGASGTLAKQIESGAPADIFIAANEEWMTYLKQRRLVSASDTLACNTLVFAGSTEKKVTGMHDLAALGRIAMGSPKSVPAGEYATEAISKAGLTQQLSGKLVFAKDVRESMMYAERGEVEGAFVYRTDALLGRRARILFTVPQQLYPRISYPMALTTSAAGKSEAAAFIRYLKGPEAVSVLRKYGFSF